MATADLGNFYAGAVLEGVGWLLVVRGLYARRKEEREATEASLNYLTARVSELSKQLEKKDTVEAKEKEDGLWTEEEAPLAKAIIEKYSETHPSPKFLLERKINIIMKSGKSREEALAKLYDEEIGSGKS